MVATSVLSNEESVLLMMCSVNSRRIIEGEKGDRESKEEKQPFPLHLRNWCDKSDRRIKRTELLGLPFRISLAGCSRV